MFYCIPEPTFIMNNNIKMPSEQNINGASFPDLKRIYTLVKQRRGFFFNKMTRTLNLLNQVVNLDPILKKWYTDSLKKQNQEAFFDLQSEGIPCLRTLQNNCSTISLSFSFLLINEGLVPCITRTQCSPDSTWEQIMIHETMSKPNFEESEYVPLDCNWLSTFCEYLVNRQKTSQLLYQYMNFTKD